MLKGIQNIHGTELHAVLVASDQTTADSSVIGILAVLIEEMGVEYWSAPWRYRLAHPAVWLVFWSEADQRRQRQS